MLVCSASYGVLSLVTGSITAFAVWAFMGVAFVVATISLLHMYLKSREQLEAREHRQIKELEGQMRMWAVILPPIPSILLGVLVLTMRLAAERGDIEESRRR